MSTTLELWPKCHLGSKRACSASARRKPLLAPPSCRHPLLESAVLLPLLACAILAEKRLLLVQVTARHWRGAWRRPSAAIFSDASGAHATRTLSAKVELWPLLKHGARQASPEQDPRVGKVEHLRPSRGPFYHSKTYFFRLGPFWAQTGPGPRKSRRFSVPALGFRAARPPETGSRASQEGVQKCDFFGTSRTYV